MAHEHDDHGHGHGGSRFIQHHYDDAQHQFDSGKLGIWLFLAQEILFFSALFVAYIVYRANHPEVFAYAHKYLDTNMGAINTGVLILSSLTAAWAVRAAQLSQKKILVFMLAVTIVCACGFLVVKYFEYSHKAHIGTLFGTHFKPSESPDGTSLKVKVTPKPEDCKPDQGAIARVCGPGPLDCEEPPALGLGVHVCCGTRAAFGCASSESLPDAPASKVAVTPEETAGPEIKDGMAPPQPTGPLVRTGELPEEPSHYSGAPPPNTAMFFTIYFAMTGLHGLHVAIGILVFIWLLWRAIKGHFTPDYFGPVDYAALYWHLVDLIWIYLFPLLYLIH